MEGVTHLSVDVTDEDAVNAAVQQVIQKETKIDAVINCAGFGISGAVEFTSMEQAKAQFDVNFFGTVTVNKAVLPFMRHQGKGHIVNISSVAAVAHIPFQTFYSASKAAVSSYSYALANEVKPYGIHVTDMKIDAMNTWTIAADAKAGTAQNSIDFKVGPDGALQNASAAMQGTGLDLSKNAAFDMGYQGIACLLYTSPSPRDS